jgi:IMP dehydrogenase
MQEISLGLTFDDVLLIPQYTNISSRSEVNLKSKFSRNVPLNIPLVSSPMDTVTETEMAIGLARLGGLGIIHRY